MTTLNIVILCATCFVIGTCAGIAIIALISSGHYPQETMREAERRA